MGENITIRTIPSMTFIDLTDSVNFVLTFGENLIFAFLTHRMVNLCRKFLAIEH
jgi:hypothetical protein